MNGTNARPTPHEPPIDAERHSWFRTQVAPLPLGQATVVYVLMAIPAIVWAIAGWPFALMIVAMLPSLVLSSVWGHRRARDDGAARRSVSTDAKTGAVLGLGVGVAVGVAGPGNERYLGIIMLVTVLLFDPYSRRAYQRRRYEG